MHILIVDDNSMVCTNIASKIKRLKPFQTMEIHIANCVKEAEILFDEYSPGIVFTDICMPVINGITLIERLRSRNKHCVIIAISGYDNYIYVRKAFLSGVNDYILKPLSIHDLADKLDKAKSILGENNPEPSITSETLNPEEATNLVHYIEQYIDLHYKQNITLADLANNMSISYSYFSRIFKKIMGESFPSYLLKIRIEKAKKYLWDPDLTIGEIASKVGYEDANHFSSAFKKYTHLNPSDYRKTLSHS